MIDKETKTTEFYKINIARPDQADIDSYTLTDNEFNNACINLIKERTESLAQSDESLAEFRDNFIEIYESDESGAFGIVGKSNSVERGLMKRIKNREGKEIESTEFLVENLRYFYINYSDLKISIIRNYQAPQVKELFTNFISTAINSKFKDAIVLINPVIDTNVNDKINKWKELSKVSMKFNSESQLKSQAVGLSTLLNYSKSNIVSSSVEIRFKNQIINDKFKDFISDEGNLSNFDKLEISGDTSDSEETIDLIKKHLIKKVNLDLSDEELTKANEYLDKIKKALIQSFV
ncbi:MAG: hypothetical protein PUG50_07065 [Eubacteriales bacterium]|uniref:hypothetical protein n=1 Tax=Fenollaria sp. TaxID=1965292 RepID=UPI002A759F8E|nr:hypothetical protein [Fenollaria sp.]MDD7340327.1 hypothetical protein [Eubacteriales bacterium]MDY3105222.1 hypothetical protein [Fenollaria sp.]